MNFYIFVLILFIIYFLLCVIITLLDKHFQKKDVPIGEISIGFLYMLTILFCITILMLSMSFRFVDGETISEEIIKVEDINQVLEQADVVYIKSNNINTSSNHKNTYFYKNTVDYQNTIIKKEILVHCKIGFIHDKIRKTIYEVYTTEDIINLANPTILYDKNYK